MFNERGYLKSNSFSIDGNEIINDFNGNLIYTQQLEYMPVFQNGLSLDLKMTYNGNVGHFTYGGKVGQSLCETKLNLPEWIISLNGVAIQTFNFENELISWELGGDVDTSYNDDVAALVNGYHSCYSERHDPNYGIVSILMGDGSIKQLYCQSTGQTGPYGMEAGEYLTKSKRDRARGYLWSTSDSLFGYFTLFNENGTQTIFEIYKPEFKTCVKIYGAEVPELERQRPKILLPVEFRDNMGHSIHIDYHKHVSDSAIYGRPLVNLIYSNDSSSGSILFAWLNDYFTSFYRLHIQHGNTLHEIQFFSILPEYPYTSSFVSLWQDKNRASVKCINHTNSIDLNRETEFVYRSCSRIVDTLKFENNEFERCENPSIKMHAGIIYSLFPIRLHQIHYPDGGRSFFTYYKDSTTTWPDGSLLIEDQLSVEPNDFTNPCINQTLPKIPCIKSMEFNNLGRDPFYSNMVVAVRRDFFDEEIISLDSLEFSWFDYDFDEQVSELDSFWTVRHYTDNADLFSANQVKKREILYQYYPERGPYSSSARDRGWVIKMQKATQSKYGASDWIETKKYTWDIGNCQNYVCDGTFELLELETKINDGINTESYIEYFSHNWQGDSTSLDNNSLLQKDKTDAWGIKTETYYNDSYFEADDENDYYTNTLIDSVVQKDANNSDAHCSTVWYEYYDGTTDDGFRGQLKSKNVIPLPFRNNSERTIEYKYFKGDPPKVRDSGALKETTDPEGYVTTYDYPSGSTDTYFLKWCYDETTHEYPIDYSSFINNTGPYWHHRQMYLSSDTSGERLETYRYVDRYGRLAWLKGPNSYGADIHYDDFNRAKEVILPGSYGPCTNCPGSVFLKPPPDFQFTEADPYPILYDYDDEYDIDPVSIESKIQIGDYAYSNRNRAWFDGFGRLTQSDSYVTVDSFTSTYKVYDFADRVIKETDQLSYSDSICYDHFDRSIKTIYPDPSNSEFNINYFITNIYDPDLGLDQFSFPIGTEIIYGKEYVDENGNVVEEYSDVRGRLRLKRTYTDDNHTSELNTYFDYDELGNPSLVIKPLGDSISYRYNSLGELLEITSPDQGRTLYQYDKNGNLVAMQTEKLRDMSSSGVDYWQTIKYDRLHRPIEIWQNSYVPDTLPCRPEKVEDSCELIVLTVPSDISKKKLFWYDQDLSDNSKGRLSATFSFDSLDVYNYGERYHYDPRGRIAKQLNYFQARTEEVDTNGHFETAITGDSVVLEFTYNLADQITSITYPDGLTVEYEYDYAGRLEKVGLYDDDDYYARISYTDRNEIETIVLGSGVYTDGLQIMDYEYNERGWLTEINDGMSGSSIPGDLFAEKLYYYDYPGYNLHQYNGNIEVQQISIAGFDERFFYVYDASDRLYGSGREDDTSSLGQYMLYEYDANGNRTKLTFYPGGPKETDYIYDSIGSPNRMLGITNADTNTYAYDMNGNIILDSVRHASMRYDVFDRLEEVKIAQPLSEDSNRLWFGYNTDDQRVIKTYSYWVEECFDSIGDPGGGGGGMTTNGFTMGGPDPDSCQITSTTHRTYYVRAKPLGGKVLTEQPCGEACGPTYAFIYAGDQRIAMYDNQHNLYFFLNDHLGSARVVVKSDGTIKDKYWYDSFGENRSIQDSTLQAYRYTGKPFEDDNGLELYYYGARWYDPELGRFLSVDPLASKYPGLSPYIYCANNPLKFVDPDGHFFDIFIDIISVAWSGYDCVKDPSLKNFGGLAIDIGAAILPFVPAIGLVDKGVDAAKGIKKASNVTDNAKVGKEFEEQAIKKLDLDKNTKKMGGEDPKTRERGNVIPDAKSKSGKMVEIKAVNYLYDSKQLRIMNQISLAKAGIPIQIVAKRGVRVSSTVSNKYIVYKGIADAMKGLR
jgi:RHS repeat-associated protein